MRDLDLKTLRLFIHVCERGSIAYAAKEAHIEPSAISKRLAQLEHDLGSQLLTRDRGRMEPTPAGLALLERARGVLFAVERMASDVAAFNNGVKGRVSICASLSAVAEALLDDITSFMREPHNRDIQVDVEERTSFDVVRHIREGAASVGVCSSNADLGGLQARPYRLDQLALVVHSDHPLARRESIRFDETLDYDHVSLPHSTPGHAVLQGAAATAGRKIASRVVVSSFDSALRVVAAGLAISVLPVEVTETYRRSFPVKVIPLTDHWAHRRFVVCFKSFDELQPIARRMVEHLCRRATESQLAEKRSSR
ncbi:LysR family transcriptional regulator [Paraburkholderia phenoliruptrix]|uniref:LysR family transcriptional regulator n=1 Tax=Paraburkholderia phenoliruptrix TaxID=252970 RepID=A0ABV3WLM2_9BURK